ncbi:MAG: sulfite exporter TauE/SafE family protein [Desulfobacterales bacterium]|nr:sulfite exporter TauE/SafE family protein [Desulfobacterales bacterium]
MLSIDGLSFALFSTGLAVGFGHCIGMCGPIVISLSLAGSENRIGNHLCYNIGRTITYSVLGGILAVTGSFTGLFSEMGGFQKGVMIFSGALIVFMGISMTGLIPKLTFPSDCFNSSGGMGRLLSKVTRKGNALSFLILGIVLGFLPCGPVYTALLSVARSGMGASDKLQAFFYGFILMALFGIGTMPALLIVGRLSTLKWLKSRKVIYNIGAVTMIGVGIYFIYQGIKY